MNAQHILQAVRSLTSAEDMQDKIASYQDTIRTLIERVEVLSDKNRQEERLERLFKKMRCPACSYYLASKAPGDTIEVTDCTKVFLFCMAVTTEGPATLSNSSANPPPLWDTTGVW